MPRPPGCAAGRRVRPVCAAGASPRSRPWRRRPAGRPPGAPGEGRRAAGGRRGAHRVREAYLAAGGVDARLFPELPDDGVPPVLPVVDEASGQCDAPARGGDGPGDDDQGGARGVVDGLQGHRDRQGVAVGDGATGRAGAGPAGDALSVGCSATRTVRVRGEVGGRVRGFGHAGTVADHPAPASGASVLGPYSAAMPRTAWPLRRHGAGGPAQRAGQRRVVHGEVEGGVRRRLGLAVRCRHSSARLVPPLLGEVDEPEAFEAGVERPVRCGTSVTAGRTAGTTPVGPGRPSCTPTPRRPAWFSSEAAHFPLPVAHF